MAILDLPEGEHQYKFLVDGQWTHDPAEVMFAVSHCLLSEASEEEKGAVPAGEREVSDGCWPGWQHQPELRGQGMQKRTGSLGHWFISDAKLFLSRAKLPFRALQHCWQPGACCAFLALCASMLLSIAALDLFTVQ